MRRYLSRKKSKNYAGVGTATFLLFFLRGEEELSVKQTRGEIGNIRPASLAEENIVSVAPSDEGAVSEAD